VALAASCDGAVTGLRRIESIYLVYLPAQLDHLYMILANKVNRLQNDRQILSEADGFDSGCLPMRFQMDNIPIVPKNKEISKQ